MRYLNKVIFINSASVKYAEISIDGNVHFIGTQGVGKSTTLRAILFFYNADKLKLGISKEKKSFDEYYFPYANSFIVYEVMRETGPYCVLAFKAQGRVCFRFFDGEYNKDYFIDPEGKAYESWDKNREAFGRNVYYSRKIDRYEEYRDILYGNNKGLLPEFRKYALIESRQYQNIPRTIQNVFLNSKLEAEFIKQTIIKSLNEEDIKIDLNSYLHHLKDFETQLNDIRKWTEKNKSGEVPVRQQANSVVTLHAALKHLEREKLILASQLQWAVEAAELRLPELIKKLNIEEANRDKLSDKLIDTEKRFQNKQSRINTEIAVLDNKLKEAKIKWAEYVEMDIESLIKKVEKKAHFENDKQYFLDQKELLSAKFGEITQKYDAQVKQLQNRESDLKNIANSEKNKLKENYFIFKEKLANQYKKLIEEIKKNYHDALALSRNLLEEKQEEIKNLQIRKAKAEHKRFYEQEIENSRAQIIELQNAIKNAVNEASRAEEQIKTLQQQWALEEERNTENYDRQKEKLNEQISGFNNAISAFDEKLLNSKNSLYGWLNAQMPGWENTIGKVIDEENILFHTGLSPAKKADTVNENTFYGLNLDLNEITKTVKTLADYEEEKSGFKQKSEKANKTLATLTEKLAEDAEKLKRKYQPKIKELKELIQNKEYTAEQSKIKLDAARLKLEEFSAKATTEKKAVIEQIETEIQRKSEEILEAKKEVKAVEERREKEVVLKRKEKSKKEEAEQLLLNNSIAKIEEELKNKLQETALKIAETKAREKDELAGKGADTNAISIIENKLSEITAELDIIEKNRDKVAEFNKDKRELFDKTSDFKNEKLLLEKELQNEFNKHHQQKLKLDEELKNLNFIIEKRTKGAAEIEDGLKEYAKFRLTDCFKNLATENNVKSGEESKTELRITELISALNAKYYSGIERYNQLQTAINKFLGNFSAQNIFYFPTNLIEKKEFLQFADELKDFLEEDKIAEYEKRVNQRFADIIKLIGKNTSELISKEAEIHKVISDINKDFVARNFAGVIKSIELRMEKSANRLVQLLLEIKNFNDKNTFDLGAGNLFSSPDRESTNKRAVELLKEIVKEINSYKTKEITLSDSFELQFRIVENDNDSGWVEKLANVGSDGTDVLVKAMINIMLLNVFKEGASRRFKDFRLHCMMDEIGKLHPTNVKGILEFANSRNILLINSSPTSYNAADYRYTYLLAKDAKNVTLVKRLIKKGAEA